MDSSVNSKQSVTVGPVSPRLCRSDSRRRHFLPKLALAVTALAAGFIVHAALEQMRIRHENSFVSPEQEYLWRANQAVRSSPRVAVPDRQKLSGEDYSQVQSVVELLGAFDEIENIVTATADDEISSGQSPNPLTLSDESPTTPVAYYSSDSDGSDEQLGPVEDPDSETASDSDTADRNATASATELATSAITASGDASIDDQQKSRDNSSTKGDVPESLQRQGESATPTAVAVQGVPADNLLQVRSSNSPVELTPTPVETASDVDPHRDSDSSFRKPPVGNIPASVQKAIAGYDRALAAIQDGIGPLSKSQARRFYTALAHLVEVSWQNDSDLGRLRVAEIRNWPELLSLVSAAAPSWLRWPNRESAGMAVVGAVQSAVPREHGYILTVRAADSRSSELELFVEDFDFQVDNTVKMLFYGVTNSPSTKGQSLIHARLAAIVLE